MNLVVNQGRAGTGGSTLSAQLPLRGSNSGVAPRPCRRGATDCRYIKPVAGGRLSDQRRQAPAAPPKQAPGLRA